MDGWIKLWRKLLRSDMYKSLSSEQRDVMFACLLLASHNGNTWEWNGQAYTCDPGEFITSLESLNEVTAKNVSIQNIRTALNKLKKWQFLTYESTKSGRKISIINWDTYQGDQQTSQQSYQQRPNKELTTIKKGENVQEEEYSPSYEGEPTTSSDEVVLSSPSSNGSAPLQKIASFWNEALEAYNSALPRLKKIQQNTQRHKHIRARWKENPDLETWKTVIRKVAASDFLNGRITKFRADFDWVVKSPDNFNKALEGKYDNRTSPGRDPDEPIT